MARRVPYLLFVYRVAKSKKAKQQQQQRLTSKVSNSAVTRMRPLLFMMFGSNIAEIRTETVKLSAYWARPVSSSGASFFALLVGNKGQRESRGIGNEARGTQERRKRRGETPAKSCLFLLPSFVCAQIYIERETSGTESGLDQTIWDELFQGRFNSTGSI